MTATILKPTFWQITDKSELEKEIHNNTKIKAISKLEITDLVKILEQYRFIVKEHANHLAIIISRMEESSLKSLFSDILYEELGNGKVQNSHFTLFNQFLTTLKNQKTFAPITQKLEEELSNYHQIIQTENIYFAIGLGGAGTECICQVYLTAINNNLRDNPHIKNIKSKIDWRFWNIHTGEVDLEHQQAIKKALIEEINTNPNIENELIKGYLASLNFWRNFINILTNI